MTTPTPDPDVKFYDPTNPGGRVQTESDFNELRWARVGASQSDLERLAAAHERRSADARYEENARLRALPDDLLRAELDKQRSKSGEATVAEATEEYSGGARDVLGKVGDDPEKAETALLAEKARPDGPRANVVRELDKVIQAHQPAGKQSVHGDSGRPQG